MLKKFAHGWVTAKANGRYDLDAVDNQPAKVRSPRSVGSWRALRISATRLPGRYVTCNTFDPTFESMHNLRRA